MIEIEKARIQGEREKLSFSCPWPTEQARSDPKSKELSALRPYQKQSWWRRSSWPARAFAIALSLHISSFCQALWLPQKASMQQQSLTDQLQWVNLSDLHSSWTSSRDSCGVFVLLIIFLVGSSFLHWTTVCWSLLPGSLGRGKNELFLQNIYYFICFTFGSREHASFEACPCQCTCGQVLSQRQSGNR